MVVNFRVYEISQGTQAGLDTYIKLKKIAVLNCLFESITCESVHFTRRIYEQSQLSSVTVD
jgi:hypothetical protein